MIDVLVYECKNCGQVLFDGLVNEFDEVFCNRSCYEQYCAENNYEVHQEKLKPLY